MKRVIALILLFLMLITSFSGCANLTTIDTDDFMTRGAWIQLLATYFGMDDYQNEEPYYSDIKSDDDIFAYVQSCVEWDVLSSDESKLNPNKFITKEYMIETAVKAADFSCDDEIELAVEYGLISSSKNSTIKDYASVQDAYNCVLWAVELYKNREFVEYENVVINTDVIDATDEIITVTDDGFYAESVEYSIGDIIIAPATIDNPSGVAMKITDVVYEDDQVYYITEEPELGEVYDEFEVAARVVPTVDDVYTSEGVTVTSSSSVDPMSNTDRTIGVTTLAYTKSSDEQYTTLADSKGINMSFNVNFTNGKINVSPSWNTSYGQFEADISSVDEDLEELGTLFSKTNYIYYHDENGRERNLYAENKFTGGYEITGSLSIENLYVDVECKTKKAFGVPYGIEYYTKEVNYEVESSLSIKGTLNNELTICTMPIAVGATGLTVELQFILYVEASGELSIKVAISNNTNIEYRNGSTKKTSTTEKSAEAEACITIQTGPQFKVTLKAFGIKIIDALIKAGVELEFKATLTARTTEDIGEEGIKTITDEYVFAASGMFYYPIITISVGTSGTLANKVGITFSWKMCDKKNGLMTSQSVEIFNKEWILFQDITTEELEIDEITQSTEASDSGNAESETKFGETLMIDVYYISLEKGASATITITTMPEKYNTSDFTFISTDESVVTVDKNGNITAKGNGTATVKVVSKDGKYSAECAVNVGDDKISFTPI